MLIVLIVLFSAKSGDGAQEIRKDISSHPNWRLLDRGDDCGFSSNNRIIGGHQAALGQYPWIVQLGYMVEPDPSNIEVDLYNCGGAIISDRYVLTAAHCNPNFLPDIPGGMTIGLVQVRVGEHDVRTDPDCLDKFCAPPVQDINIESYVCHPKYDNSKKQHDICLIRLATPITFNRFVAPICLPAYKYFTNKTYDNTVMEVAGWGVTDILSGNKSDVLMSLKVPVYHHNKCKLKYSGYVRLSKGQLCAGGVIGKDSCSADSGGPLMAPFSLEAPPRYFLVGVVSFGPSRCSVLDIPGVYTKVSHYMPWILDNITE